MSNVVVCFRTNLYAGFTVQRQPNMIQASARSTSGYRQVTKRIIYDAPIYCSTKCRNTIKFTIESTMSDV